MDIFSKIAEEKIREAIEKGVFNDLAGKGKPIAFEDDSFIPEDKRMAYKILKNSGCVPPELEMKKEVHNLMHLISNLEDPSEREKKIKELNFKLLKFNISMKRPLNMADFPEYQEKLSERLLKK